MLQSIAVQTDIVTTQPAQDATKRQQRAGGKGKVVVDPYSLMPSSTLLAPQQGTSPVTLLSREAVRLSIGWQFAGFYL